MNMQWPRLSLSGRDRDGQSEERQSTAFDAYAEFVNRHRRLILGVAGVVAIVAAAFSLSLHPRLTSGWSDWDDPGSANVQARQTIEHATGISPQQGYALLVHSDQRLDPAAPPPPVVNEAIQVLRGRPEVRQVLDYHSTRNPALISADGRSTVVMGQVGQVVENKVVPQLEKQINQNAVLAGHVVLGGLTTGDSQLSGVVLHDLTFAELIVFPLLFLALIVVFRGVIAAALPLLGGGIALLITMLALRIIVEFHAVSIFGLNLAFALGLGLSIDFSLLIVSRYRERLASEVDELTALRQTMNTAGKTVLYSGLTIGSALVALLTFPQRFLYSMGLAGIIVTVAALVSALVVLPATLAVLGGRVEKFAPSRWQRHDKLDGSADPSAARWRRLAVTVMRRPAMFATLATVILLGLAYPLLGVKFTAVQAGNTLPQSVSAGQVEAAMNTQFPIPISDREYAVIDAPPTANADVEAFVDKLRSIQGIAEVGAPKALDASHWQVPISLKGKPVSELSRNAVGRIHDVEFKYRVRLAGPTADALALNTSLGRHLPVAAVMLVMTTLGILFIMTGSIVLPIKAVIMNALSLAAALGVITSVFQNGHFTSLLGRTAQGALDSSMPVLLAAVAFGLSTDYGVFLLGRIKEAYDQGATNRESVAIGIEHTGRIVTSAAVLMCLALCAMLLSRIVLIQELGLGGAAAVILDATVVRALLVPALMTLLGDFNWWAPRWLRRPKAQVPDAVQSP
jgi:RND superfamily putative drug exporter